MCNGPTYRYSLEIDGTFTTVTPINDGGFQRVVSKADGEEYYRTTLSGEVRFVRADFDLINGASIEDQINFNMEKWDGTTWQTYFSGYFTKADCSFEIDQCGDGICSVTPTPRDFYDPILGGIDKEFDLIELAPAKTTINYKRQPIFQVYALGDSVLSCYLGGTYFEIDVPTPINNTNDLFSTYIFGYAGSHVVLFGESLDPDVSGEYINDVSLTTLTTAPSYVRKSDGAYKIQLSGTTWQVVDASTSAVLYQSDAGAALFDDPLTAVVSGALCYASGKNMFTRFITNQTDVGGTPTTAIPSNDIVSNPAGYSNVLAIGLTNVDVPAGTDWENVIIAHAGHTATPTRWGRFADDADAFAGEYFTKPTGAGTGAIYPQGESGWTDSSFWFQYDATLRAFQESGAESLVLKDAYKIADVLDAILGELSAGVSHSESSTFSNFLYGASNAVRGSRKYPVITPKSNITVGEYDEPAKKGPIRLSDVLQLLWNALRCKWHIDASGNFIVEHISYYENGGGYSGTEVGADLTTLLDPQTGKSWEFAANRWEYEKEAMPERLEPGWMDRTTRPFDGYPIEVRSIFVQKGNIESQKVGRFTSDIDFMQLQPGDIAKEGFVFMEAELVGTDYVIPYVVITLPDSTEFKVQNGYAAFTWMHPQYHRYHLPAELVTVNEGDTTALSVARRKIQEIDYPVFSTTSYLALVTTGLGSGKILELAENVDGQFVKVKIAHDTQ